MSIASIRHLCEQLDIHEIDLDELVHEASMQKLKGLNEVVTSRAQDAIITHGEVNASHINNEGLEAQIGFLIEAWGAPEVQRQIKNLKHEANV